MVLNRSPPRGRPDRRLFAYVFGGAIDTGSQPYVNYLLPGILLITIASGVSYTAFRLLPTLGAESSNGSSFMPIARSGVLWAHVLTSLVANLTSLAVVLGVVWSWAPYRRRDPGWTRHGPHSGG